MSFQEAELKRDDALLRISLLEMDNAVVAFFYEGKIDLGTLAVALPRMEGMSAQTSSVLLGGRFQLVSRSLAESVSVAFGKMSLVSVRTSLPEGEALRSFTRLFDDLLSKRPKR